MEPHPGLHDAPGSVTLSLIISLKQSLASRVKSSEKRIDPPSAWPGPSGRKPSAMLVFQAQRAGIRDQGHGGVDDLPVVDRQQDPVTLGPQIE